MFHRTKFCELRIAPIVEGKSYWLELSSRKTGKSSCLRFVSGDLEDAKWKFRIAARYLNDHPSVKPGEITFTGMDAYWHKVQEERRIRYDLYCRRVMDVKRELGLDWEDIAINDFSDLREKADAEYDRAVDMAADYYKAYGIERVDGVWYVFDAAKGLGCYWTYEEAAAAANEMNQDWGDL